MKKEDAVIAARRVITEEWGINIINLNERNDNKDGYKWLAIKYFPEYYDFVNLTTTGRPRLKKGYEVHHIDFDHSNNVISNIVVLTVKQHRTIHYRFDPTFNHTKKLLSSYLIGKPPYNKGKRGVRKETSDKMSAVHKDTHRVYDNPEHTKWHMEKN